MAGIFNTACEQLEKEKNMKKQVFTLMLVIALVAFTIVSCTEKTETEVESINTAPVIIDTTPVIEPEEIPDYITIGDMRFETSLTELNLQKQQLNNSDIEDLKYMKNLTILILNSNQISDISVLAGLTNLTHLYISNNQISDISALTGLTNLTGLGIYNNQISDISVLTGLTNLTELYIDGNPVKDISALAELKNLKGLALIYSEQISDINVLAGLTNLERLYLETISDEQLSELEAILPNTNIIVS